MCNNLTNVYAKLNDQDISEKMSLSNVYYILHLEEHKQRKLSMKVRVISKHSNESHDKHNSRKSRSFIATQTQPILS